MKHYLKLVNFEMGRFFKIFVGLALLLIVSQMTFIIITASSYMADINSLQVSDMEALSQKGPFRFMFLLNSMTFTAPIFLCIAGVGGYIFFIWYRDWFGKNTFIYRLLMLPVGRMAVYWAKLTTIVLYTMSFVAVELLLLPMEYGIMSKIVPAFFRLDLGWYEMITSTDAMVLFLPGGLITFILTYGAGLMAVMVIFTVILLERSYHIKGIILIVPYILVVIAILAAPSFIQYQLLDAYFYTGEMVSLKVLAGIVVVGLSLWMSRQLMAKKVTV